MSQLGRLFNSTTKTRVLRTLWFQELPVHLRAIERLTDCSLRSVELVLKELHREGLVARRKSGIQTFFALNRSHDSYPLITEILSAASNFELRSQKDALNKRAVKFFKFVSDTNKLIQTGKQSIANIS